MTDGVVGVVCRVMAVRRFVLGWLAPIVGRRGVREAHAMPVTTHDVDLTEALQVLQHAGYPEPSGDGASAQARIEYVLHALCELTIHDGLTGLVNARQLRTVVEQEVERSFRTGQPCSLLMIDLDHFKAINDRSGHQAGDRVLQSVGRVIKAGIRTMDTAARYGGEEFAVLLPNTSKSSAAMIAERVRSKIACEVIACESTVIPVTCSIGVGCLDTRARHTGAELIKMADIQLYRAKSLGRNRVCSGEQPTLSVSRDERIALSVRSLDEEDAR